RHLLRRRPALAGRRQRRAGARVLRERGQLLRLRGRAVAPGGGARDPFHRAHRPGLRVLRRRLPPGGPSRGRRGLTARRAYADFRTPGAPLSRRPGRARPRMIGPMRKPTAWLLLIVATGFGVGLTYPYLSLDIGDSRLDVRG